MQSELMGLYRYCNMLHVSCVGRAYFADVALEDVPLEDVSTK